MVLKMTHTLHPRITTLLTRFNEIAQTSMRDMPLSKPNIQVETVNFEWVQDDAVLQGILITPWAMNLLRISASFQAQTELVGTKHTHHIGDAEFTFYSAFDEVIGAYEMCSLESPLSCETQELAREIAQAVLLQLYEKQTTAPESLARRGFLTGKRA